MIRFLPKGWRINLILIVFSAFLFGTIGTVGVLLIIDNVNADLEAVIFGAILIVLAILIITVFAFWFTHVFRLEINADSVILYNFSVRPRRFILNENTLKELKNIEVDKNRIIYLSYIDGGVDSLKLKLFSRKQIERVKSEILNRACSVNGYMPEVEMRFTINKNQAINNDSVVLFHDNSFCVDISSKQLWDFQIHIEPFTLLILNIDFNSKCCTSIEGLLCLKDRTKYRSIIINEVENGSLYVNNLSASIDDYATSYHMRYDNEYYDPNNNILGFGDIDSELPTYRFGKDRYIKLDKNGNIVAIFIKLSVKT